MTCLWLVGGGREQHRLGVQIGSGFTQPVDGELPSAGRNFQFKVQHSCLGNFHLISQVCDVLMVLFSLKVLPVMINYGKN